MAEAPKPEEIKKPEETPTIIPPETPVAPSLEEEKQTLEKKVADYEFKDKIGEVSKTYPHALDFKDEIQKLVNEKGYSIEDASLVVLNAKGKLQTAEQIARARNTGDRSMGMGGSMDNPPPRDKKDPVPGEPGSAQFYADRFKDLEAKGEIRVI